MIYNNIETTKILRNALIGGAIESYGVQNQTLFLQIRNDADYNIRISSTVRIVSDKYPYKNKSDIDLDLNGILIFHYLNLKRIKNVYCSDNAVLIIEFENGEKIYIGEKLDIENYSGEEPWDIIVEGEESQVIAESVIPATFMIIGDW